MKKGNTLRLLVILCLSFAACCVYCLAEETESMKEIESHVNGDMIRFSADSGYYTGDVTVTLSKDMETPLAAKIYYTLDGNDPTAEDGTLYQSGIRLEQAAGELRVYPLKAALYYRGEYSDTFERTYVVGDEALGTFSLGLISLTSDSDNLYDYETGIMVPGKTYDDNADAGNVGYTQYIEGNANNRGDDWIRNAHVALLDADHSIELEQDVGLGISGKTSPAYDVKSFKIYANMPGEETNDKLRLDFELSDEEQGKPYSFVEKYNSIRLRSGSQDIDRGNIRSSVISRLADMSGFDGCSATKRYILYLNGSFYGIFDMQQNYSDSWLANRFGLGDSQYVEKHKGQEEMVFPNWGITDLMQKDLSAESNRSALEAAVDMDNYLLYCAVEVLCDNPDWPGNNFEIWRYTGEPDRQNPYTDGRWRFLFYDADLIYFPSELLPDSPEDWKADIFVSLMEKKYLASDSLFSHVMESKYYRDKFVTIVCDLLNTSFSPENAVSVIEEEKWKIAGATEAYYGSDALERAEAYVKDMEAQASRRPEEMNQNFADWFGLTETYDLSLETTDGVAVLWDNRQIFADSAYDGRYYCGAEFTMTADAYPGYTFRHWLVNGVPVTGEKLTVSEQLVRDHEVEIRAVAEPENGGRLVISEIFAKDHDDWIRISNVGASPVETKQYYLTDRGDNLVKYQLPDLTLAPGESVVIDGSKNHDKLGDYICNFSLRARETLILSDGEKTLDSLVVPDMTDAESYGRYDGSGIWRYFLYMI